MKGANECDDLFLIYEEDIKVIENKKIDDQNNKKECN
jgi:hypothetical protein